jgi:PD-(D/E)XK nuclease superfamily
MQDKSSFETLPTGKPHVSFSEVKQWKECSFRHHLVHVKKLDVFKPSPVLEFGTAVHAACEDYLLTRVMKVEIAHTAIQDAWKKNENIEEFNERSLNEALRDSSAILSEVPAFLDETFPEWTVVDAEHELYESIEGHPHAFKGFIDGVIKAKGKKGEDLYWILDWKTSARGWFREKRSDDMVKAQLALYKNFWHKKNPQVPFKDIRCGFVILKKSGKPGTHCELFTVPMGEVPITRSLKVVSNMITSVKRGMSIKNKSACTYCEFRETEHCP